MSAEIPDEVNDAFTRLSDKLDPTEISDVQAIRAFLVRQFNVLLYERAQLAKRQQAHGEFVRNLQAELAGLQTIANTARADWERSI